MVVVVVIVVVMVMVVASTAMGLWGDKGGIMITMQVERLNL